MSTADIFIDEFGNVHLDLSKGGTFSHFIYTAIVFNKDSENRARLLRESLCKKYRLGDNIKSSNIKEKHFDKRLQILNDLCNELDFTIDVLVIDKSKIDSSGLKQHKVFYKFFQSLFVNKYNQKYQSYQIFADSVGTDFKSELESYVRSKSIQRDLWHPDRNFNLSNDVSGEKLIQFADLVCGSIGKVFCASHSHKRAREIYEILHTRLSVDYFPFRTTRFSTNLSDSIIDKQIMKLNLELIENYINNSSSKANQEKNLLLNYLLLHSEISPNRLIPTYEIVAYISNYIDGFTDDRLRLVIRDLRYEGLFVISYPGKPGYKLANCYNDIFEHYNHFMKYVIPMLQKIKIINQSIAENTFNELNPLEHDPSLSQLKDLLAGFK